ncbi:MAG: tetratricopeptide repeat-containing sensor histidine kinase [Chitinophagaceae bacterium]|nr:tetratricopeptide repeat-containing sensor histidine kinase [Chitinophagaceae bacterium]
MRYTIFLILLLYSLFAEAQKEGQALVDSEVSVLPGAKNDSMRARICNNVANYYQDVNTDSALKYADMGMGLVSRMNWIRGIAVFNTAYANIFTTKGLLDSALNRHRRALDLFIKINDSFNIAASSNNMGTIAKAKSDFVAAARYFLNTLEIGKALKNNYLIGLGSENLGLVYEYQEDYTKGLDYARQSVAAYTLNDNQDFLPGPLSVIGGIFQRLNKGDSAIYYYRKALTFARVSGNKVKEATMLNFIADYYSSLQDYSNAIKNGLEAKKIWDVTGPSAEDAINNTGILGYYYLQLAKQSQVGNREQLLHLSTTYLEEAVQKSGTRSIKTSQSEFQISLAEAYALAGNYKGAYLNYKSYQEIKDSIYSQENKNKIASAMSKLELDKKNAEIALNQATIVNQHRQQLFLTIGLILLFVIGGLLYRQSLIRKRTNTTLLVLNNELDEANKVKAKFFGILSHDLRSPIANLITFLQLQKMRPGLLSEAQIAHREKKISDSAESLLETMEAMLLWSKGQMEHFKPSLSVVPVESLFTYLRKNFPDTEHVAINFPPADDLDLRTDENYLQTIMYNLTANAMKALQQKTDGHIAWKAWRQGDNLFLSISDNGPGASDQQLKALYDESAPSGARTGLGLHIIRDLAKAIGCTVTYNAKNSVGAEFVLCMSMNIKGLHGEEA